MCFSATASFTASAVLAATGAATIKQKKKKRDLLLSLIPLLFAIQQFFEGLIWLSLPSGSLTRWLGYAFIFFAFFVWPIYVPLSVWMHEPSKKHKSILSFFIGLGILVNVYMIFILFQQGLRIEIVHHSINYAIAAPSSMIGIILYGTATVGSLLVSSKLFLKLFGLLVFASALLTWAFFEATFTSVWCYFAAVLSIFLFYYFYSLQKQK